MNSQNIDRITIENYEDEDFIFNEIKRYKTLIEYIIHIIINLI